MAVFHSGKRREFAPRENQSGVSTFGVRLMVFDRDAAGAEVVRGVNLELLASTNVWRRTVAQEHQ
jgi:hypothetical protein